MTIVEGRKPKADPVAKRNPQDSRGPAPVTHRWVCDKLRTRLSCIHPPYPTLIMDRDSVSGERAQGRRVTVIGAIVSCPAAAPCVTFSPGAVSRAAPGGYVRGRNALPFARCRHQHLLASGRDNVDGK
jgi:hypothetical protein